jgi:ketosteroid isomerase-like protein
MAMSNTQFIENLYETLAAGDIEGFLGAFAHDIEWRETENFPYGDQNPYIGPEAVLNGVFARLGADWEPFEVIRQDYIAEGDKVVMFGRYDAVARETGRPMKAEVVHIWTVRDGKVQAFQQIVDTIPAREALAG